MGSKTQGTQWAAQFAVASELCKRGYEVSFTMGNNTPLADLMAISPSTRQMFLIDVKGQRQKSQWQEKIKQPQDNLYYVLAYVPEGSPNRFFIMTQKEVHASIKAESARLNRSDDYIRPGLSWQQGEPYENKWEKLPK